MVPTRVANLKDKLNPDRQDSLDDLLKAQEELSRDSSSHLAQKQLKKNKENLAGKLSEKEINMILAKKKEVVQSEIKLEIIQEQLKSLKISLPEIILNTIPNLVYLDLRDKSNSTIESTEQRFPDEIMNWTGFEQEVLAWQPDVNNKYPKPTFSQRRTVTCEKDIWTASDGTVGQPDFVIVNSDMTLLVVWECKTKWVLNVPPNKDIVSLYYQEKET
nr:14493_t:CDS:2 [Entrophospora candida]